VRTPSAQAGALTALDEAQLQVDAAGLRPVVSAFLRYGVLIAAFVIAVGLAYLLVQVGPKAFISMPQVRAADVNTDLTSLRGVLRELVPPEPEAVLDAGVLLLIATPVLTVGASAIAFALEGDWLYVAIAGFVFAMLLLGFILGGAGPFQGG
jgi:uncharacterized membrane protein